MSQFEATLETIRRQPFASVSGPQPPALLAAAETRLGLPFPKSYREFLRQLGAGSCGAQELFGIFQPDFENSSQPDVVWSTLNARRNYGLEDAGITIAFDGTESFHVLDTGRATANGSVPVVEWAPGDILEASPVIADDFSTYLEQVLKDCEGLTG